jgi:hypothetical protein
LSKPPYMLRLAIIVMVTFTVLGFSAQTINHAYHSGIDESLGNTGINNKAYQLYATKTVPGYGDLIGVRGFDETGAAFFTVTLNLVPQLRCASIARTVEQDILVSSGTLAKNCDTGGNLYRISRLDTNGNVLWQIDLTRSVALLLPWPDGSFYFVSDWTLVHYKGNGQYLSEFSLGTGAAWGIARTNDNHILLSQTGPSGSRLKKFDTTGVLLLDTVFTALSNIKQFSGDYLYGLAGGHLRKYSPSLAFLKSTSTLSPSITVTDYQLRGDSIFVAAYHGFAVPRYLILDDQLNALHQSATNLENARCAGVYVSSGNHVHLVATGPAPHVFGHSFTGYFQTDLAGDLFCAPDIGVTSVSPFNVKFVDNSASKLIYVFLEANATVKNYGTDTVYSFHLSHGTGGIGICFWERGFNLEFNLKISPGGTATVTTGTFEARHISLYSPVPDSISITLGTSVPNQENDSNASNDLFTAKVEFTGTGLKEASLPKVSIFPIPANDLLEIRSEEQMTRLELLSVTGTSLYREDCLTNEKRIHTKDLPAGIYLLKVTCEKGYYVKSIVLLRD